MHICCLFIKSCTFVSGVLLHLLFILCWTNRGFTVDCISFLTTSAADGAGTITCVWLHVLLLQYLYYCVGFFPVLFSHRVISGLHECGRGQPVCIFDFNTRSNCRTFVVGETTENSVALRVRKFCNVITSNYKCWNSSFSCISTLSLFRLVTCPSRVQTRQIGSKYEFLHHT